MLFCPPVKKTAEHAPPCMCDDDAQSTFNTTNVQEGPQAQLCTGSKITNKLTSHPYYIHREGFCFLLYWNILYVSCDKHSYILVGGGIIPFI